MYMLVKFKFISIFVVALVLDVSAVDVVATVGSEGHLEIDGERLKDSKLMRSQLQPKGADQAEKSVAGEDAALIAAQLQRRKEEPAGGSANRPAEAEVPTTKAVTPKKEAAKAAPVVAKESPVVAKAAPTVVKAAAPPSDTSGTADALAGENLAELPKPAINPAPNVYIASSCFITFGILFMVANQIYVNRTSKAAEEREDASDEEQLSTEGLPEDIYGMAIASICRDGQHIANNSSHYVVRICRILLSTILFWVNMALQVFVLLDIKRFSSAKAVGDIRKAYDAFETHMYQGHTYLTVNNLNRGLSASHFNAAMFATLDPDVKSTACRIPFSQPSFLFALLLIWTLQVVGELRQIWQLASRLVVNLDSADSMKNSIVKGDDDEEEIIVKLPKIAKAYIILMICIPRTIISVVLLGLGCRWLSATTDFQNLVLNAVGLEFLMLLKELMYTTLVSDRNKRDTARMQVSVAKESAAPSPQSFLAGIILFFAAGFWVFLYIFVFQQVLPDYRWDVQDVCVTWMKKNFAGYDD
eukprot:CAMPEP_0197658150 /NCGR_PEP_ID=MMETSP1338-20131121/45063_1 /TAXON_ID=43686 ORGANISM="Pelagodinium beii, Strain RCC1491" /NCGR_SAMPLE_ID=MMETSP1338 /ASSEMBLY_ACC=CAM_ASM_000754 /LENGTH=528 /DNA_ID=CAMNT_0043234683 /DNA_START=51 /DNA_END=1637 /DNA_ORIENTATION=-